MNHNNAAIGLHNAEVKERPILFQAEMVRAILEGRKIQTRRVFTMPSWAHSDDKGDDIPQVCHRTSGCLVDVECPHGAPGDRLWVRETYRVNRSYDALRANLCWSAMGGDVKGCIDYAATPREDAKAWGGKWRPSIHMPRWASRLTLEITDVRVQRVQEISKEESVAEGVQLPETEEGHPVLALAGKQTPSDYVDPSLKGNALWKAAYTGRVHFAMLWDSINAKRGFGWKVNPWVWAVSFKKAGAS